MAWNNYLKDQRSSPYISMLEGYGKNYMDPRGSQNMMMRDTYMQAGRENAGQQYREGMKMGAAGMNPFANQQYRSSLRDNTESAYRGYQSGMAQNQQFGQSMLGMGMQARMQQGQMEQQQKQWDREYKQHERGQYLTLGGTLASGLMQPGGLLGKAMPDTGTEVNVQAGEGDLNVASPLVATQKPATTTPPVDGAPGPKGGNATQVTVNGTPITPTITSIPPDTKIDPASLNWDIKKSYADDYLSQNWFGGKDEKEIKTSLDFYTGNLKLFYNSGLSIDRFLSVHNWNPQTKAVFRNLYDYMQGDSWDGKRGNK